MRKYAGLVAAFALVACGGGLGEAGTSTPAPSPTPAQISAQLTWRANQEPDLAGYRVYYGTSPGVYLQALGAGLSAGKALAMTITGLDPTRAYFFCVTAYDTSNNESAFSVEVTKQSP